MVEVVVGLVVVVVVEVVVGLVVVVVAGVAGGFSAPLTTNSVPGAFSSAVPEMVDGTLVTELFAAGTESDNFFGFDGSVRVVLSVTESACRGATVVRDARCRLCTGALLLAAVAGATVTIELTPAIAGVRPRTTVTPNTSVSFC